MSKITVELLKTAQSSSSREQNVELILKLDHHLQLEEANSASLREETILMKEFIHSFHGCNIEGLEFEFGARLEPSSMTLYSKREVESESVDMKITVWDRSGYHHIDGRLVDLEEMVHILQNEVYMSGESIEIEDIHVKELQKYLDSSFSSFPLSWKAFIQVTLKWGKHRAVCGNLVDDVGGGLWPQDIS